MESYLKSDRNQLKNSRGMPGNGEDVPISSWAIPKQLGRSSSISSYGIKTPRRMTKQRTIPEREPSDDEMNLGAGRPDPNDSIATIRPVGSRSTSIQSRAPTTKSQKTKDQGKLSKLRSKTSASRNLTLMSGHKQPQNKRREHPNADLSINRSTSTSGRSTPSSQDAIPAPQFYGSSKSSQDRKYQSTKGKGREEGKEKEKKIERRQSSSPVHPLTSSNSSSKISPEAFPSSLLPEPATSTSRTPAPFPLAKPMPKPRESLKPAPFPMDVSKENTPPVVREVQKFPMKLPDTIRLRKNAVESDSEAEVIMKKGAKGTKSGEVSKKGKGKEKEKDKHVPKPFPLQLGEPSTTGKPLSRTRSDLESRSPSPDPLQDTHETPFSFTQYFGNKDPKTLCPFCDEELPEDPSDTLLSMIEAVRKFSRPSPRIGNKLGLVAPMTRYIEVCQRHEFESVELPKAKENRWPRKIDFEALPKRIKSSAMRERLRKVIKEPTLSAFWNEIATDIVAKGARATVSAMGQLATFNRALPGYYGERGSVIMQQLLYTNFPPESLTSSSVSFDPLNPAEFIQRVLLPETALRLIMEDRSCEEEEALTVMRGSAMYGVGMFPDLGDKDQVRTAIVEARARKRRKEIAREESGEFEMDEQNNGQWDVDDIGPPPNSSFTATTSTGSSPLSVKRLKSSPKAERSFGSAKDMPNTSASGSKPRRPKPRPKVRVEDA